MNNMKCLIQGHNNGKILAMCMDKKCNEKQRLSCLLCQLKSHSTHLASLVEADQMNAFIQEEKNKKPKYPESCSYGSKYIIQGLEKLSLLINSLQKIIMEQIEIQKQQNLQDYLKQASGSQQGIEYWSQLLEGILKYVEVDNCAISLAKTNEGQLNEVEQRQIQIIKQSEETLQNMINQINSTYMKNENTVQMKKDNQNLNQMKLVKLCFKVNRKHADISIINDTLLKSKENEKQSYAIAFANEGFDPNTQSYQFAFQIHKSGSLVLVGVGNDEGGIAPNYLFQNRHKLGHGQYMINNGDLSYHHTDKEINFQQNGLKFKDGDKIQIKYDHVTKVLEFRKQSEENKAVKMTITDMTKILYPCAQLQSDGPSVQLVEY